MSVRNRCNGARLDPDRLDDELAIRGLDARSLARIACAHEMALSQAQQAEPVVTAFAITFVLQGLYGARVFGRAVAA